MDSLKFLLYTLGRIGIFIAVNLLAAFTGRIIIPALSSFVPAKSAVSSFLLNRTNGSVIAWIVLMAFMLVLFFDDGKRHAAYDIYSSISISIVLILTLMVYFVPTIFRDSFHAEGKGKAFYSIVYFPVYWLESKFNMKYTTASALGVGIILILMFVVYILSYHLYMKKYKSLYKNN